MGTRGNGLGAEQSIEALAFILPCSFLIELRRRQECGRCCDAENLDVQPPKSVGFPQKKSSIFGEWTSVSPFMESARNNPFLLTFEASCTPSNMDRFPGKPRFLGMEIHIRERGLVAFAHRFGCSINHPNWVSTQSEHSFVVQMFEPDHGKRGGIGFGFWKLVTVVQMQVGEILNLWLGRYGPQHFSISNMYLVGTTARNQWLNR